jgi:hypothetical protein
MSGVRPLLTRVLRSTQASGRAPDELSAVSTYLIGTEEDKYITRTLFPRVHDCRLLVHTLHRADREPHPHDHPWDEAVFLIVDGGYTDERWYLQDDGEWGWVRRELRPGMVNKLRAIDYHRAIEVLPDTLTFGVVGRRVQEWGFLVDGVKVPHADYHRA